MSIFPAAYPFQVYVGQHFTPDSALTEHGKWNYANDIWVNDYGSGGLPYIGQRTLVNTLSASATTGLAVTPTGFGTGGPPSWPVQGGVWVGPNGTTQGWEYIAYHSSGASLQRNPQRHYNNTHSAGAPVFFWYPLDMNDGVLSIAMEQTDNLAVRSWSAKISGVRAPVQILKPDHYIVVTMDTTGGSGSSFPILLWGLIERVSMAQDPNHFGMWEVQIQSIARALQNSEIPGLRIGPMDIALESEASASSTLGAAWKLSFPQQVQVEAGYIPEIDFVEVQDDAGPQHIVDGNHNTLWVSDGWLGNPALYANSAPSQGFATVFANPPPQHIIGSRYIELINHPTIDQAWLWMYYKYTYPGGTRAHWVQITDPNMFDQNGAGGGSLSGAEDRVVLAENATIFKQLFPAADPKVLIDGATLSGAEDTENARRLWWEGGALFWADTLFQEELWSWGNVTYAELETAWKPIADGGLGQGTTDFDLPPHTFYLDITGLRPGEVFRRELYNTNFVMVHDYIHFPGYVISDNPGGDYPEWFRIVLPEMTHLLRDNITASTTTIFLVDAQGNPNVEGITKGTAGGAIFINDEIVTFTGKNYDEGTLTGCTVTKVHKAGTRVYVRYKTPWWGKANATAKLTGDYIYPFKDKIFDYATAAYPIKTMRWGRGYYANGEERTPFLGNYLVRFSLYPDARHPPEDSHELDYMTEISLEAVGFTPAIAVPNASVNTDHPVFDIFDASEGFRPRTILFEMRSMNEEGTNLQVTERPRMNYFEAEVDREFFNPGTWLELPPAGMENYLFCYYIMLKAGLFLDVLVPENPDSDPSPKRSKGMTDRDTAWRIVADAAEYGSTEIDVTLDGRIYLRPNRYLLNATHPVDFELDNEDVVRVEVTNIRPADVGQMRVTWENPAEGTSGAAVWPETVPKGTDVTEIGPLLLPDQGTAEVVLFNLYTTRRFAHNVFIELNQYDDSYAIGSIVHLSYDFDKRGEMVDRLLLVESIDHEFSELSGRTVLGCREIEKEIA